MYVDAFTVFLFGLLVKVPLAGLFLVFWLNKRRRSLSSDSNGSDFSASWHRPASGGLTRGY